MRKRERVQDHNDFSGVRLFSLSDGCAYTGLGKTSFTDFAKQIGAVKKYGKRVLFDRAIIDNAIDHSGEDLKGGAS